MELKVLFATLMFSINILLCDIIFGLLSLQLITGIKEIQLSFL